MSVFHISILEIIVKVFISLSSSLCFACFGFKPQHFLINLHDFSSTEFRKSEIKQIYFFSCGILERFCV